MAGDGEEVGRCARFEAPLAAFPAHYAPVDLMFYSGAMFPAHYRGGAFVTSHGSWNRAPQPMAGYNVLFRPFPNRKPSGKFEVFRWVQRQRPDHESGRGRGAAERHGRG